MKFLFRSILLTGLLTSLLASSNNQSTSNRSTDPHSLILLIPDGTGPAILSLARIYNDVENKQTLNLDDMLRGSVRTYSSDSFVTDSSASATAYSTGKKTFNGAVALDLNGKPATTLMEAAKAKGMVTGVVVTSRVTHATPACFLSHVRNRNQEEEIARQIVFEQNPDFVLGGGSVMFNETLRRKLVEKGYTIVLNKEELDKYHEKNQKTGTLKLFGLFASHHLSYEMDRQGISEPNLSEMVQVILSLLEKNEQAQKNGFFIMIEGSRIDHAGHDNDPATMAKEAIAFDRTVGIVKSFVQNRPNVGMISVADHETGGLSLATLNQTLVDDMFDCADGNCNNYSKMFPYEVLPHILHKQTKSVEKIIQIITQTIASCRKSYHENPIACRSIIYNHILKQMTESSAVKSLTRVEVSNLHQLTKKIIVDKDDSYVTNLLHFISHVFSSRASIGWTTAGHSGVDVGLYCFGNTNVETMCRGVHENTYVFEIVRQFLDLDMQEIALKLRD